MGETAVGETAKNSCPRCGAKFRVGALVTAAEQRRLEKAGIIDLGEPPEIISCPKCSVKLKVVTVRMGSFFQRQA